MQDPIAHTPTAYERALCDALMGIMGEGKHALVEIVAGLNARHITTEAGELWTEDRFAAEMRRFGAGPENGPPATPLAVPSAP